MPLPTTSISLNAIHVEVGGTSGTAVSLNDADVRGIGAPDSTYAGGDGINTTSGSTISIGEFRNASDISATTYHSSISAESYSDDSNTNANSDLRVFYLNGNIDVRAYGGDTQSPSSGTTVYRISGAPSGYTVRTTVPSFSGDFPSTSGSTIGTTATSIPTFSSFVDREFDIDSGGGYDDPGDALTVITGSLIFEKSGSTTFTYSYSITLEAENAGEGGQ